MARISQRLPVALRVGDWDAVLAMLSAANLPKGDKAANLRFLAARTHRICKRNEGARCRRSGGSAGAFGQPGCGPDADERDADRAEERAVTPEKKDANAKPPTMPILPDALPEPILKCLNIPSMELRAGVLVAHSTS